MSISVRIGIASLFLIFWAAASNAEDSELEQGRFRVMSWNISGDAFVVEREAFQAILSSAGPDIVLLDEVGPDASLNPLQQVLDSLRPGEGLSWTIDRGASGGRQRGLIASAAPLMRLPEFSAPILYPESEKQTILDSMSRQDRADPSWSMEGGIPVNGAIVEAGDRRLLVVIADLQCCGDGPESWQEYRRRVEAREIRRIVRQILTRETVDGVVLAGDFNMVNSTFPMAILSGPYPAPHAGLIAAELYHLDGETTWTWDGRRTPFPSNVLDYQLYGSGGLRMRAGQILNSDNAVRTGRHRPLVADYEWVK